MTKMDWNVVASQLLRALRGRRSQRAFSRRLGYRANPSADWEAGRRFPTAREVLRICERVGLPVRDAFDAFHPQSAAAMFSGGQFTPHHWLDGQRGSASIAEVAARCGRSRFAVSRWLRGQTEPRLPDFLMLVDVLTDRVSDLVGALVDIEAVPQLCEHHRLRVAAKRLAFDAPWTEAILRVMETEDYRAHGRHPVGYLEARLGLSTHQERHALDLSERAGVLAQQDGRYRDLTPLSVDMTAPQADINRLKAHWTGVALARLQAPHPGDWLGYNVLSVSHADLERIRNLLRQTFREIRTIAAASEPVQTAALVNLQLVTWD